MTEKEIREAVARGWCHPNTENLVMDSDLVEAIVEEILKIDISPNLGCATTYQLVNEVKARVSIAKTIGEDWPNYKTINST